MMNDIQCISPVDSIYKAEEIILLPCSGGYNCGEISNQVAVKLTERGIGRMCCLAGIGSQIKDIIESAKRARRIVVIDGCALACARKMVELAGITVTKWVCITDEGISRNSHLDFLSEDVDLITRRTLEALLWSEKIEDRESDNNYSAP